MTVRFDVGSAPVGVTFEFGADGQCTAVVVDPIVAFGLKGTKAQLTALRQERAQSKGDAAAMAAQLAAVSVALARVIEAHEALDRGGSMDWAQLTLEISRSRAVLALARELSVDWEALWPCADIPEAEGLWEGLADSIRPHVTGPEGAAVLQAVSTAAASPHTMGIPVASQGARGWADELLSALLYAMATSRALDLALNGVDPLTRKLHVTVTYAALTVARLLQVPEPPTEADPT